MFNLKKAKGTYKRLIGECMFKLSRNYAVLTKYWNKRRYLDYFGKYLTKPQLDFVNEYWHSLDAIEIDYSNGFRDVYLYEIKTNACEELNLKPKINEARVLLYQKALKMGFIVKLAFVCFEDDWNYSVNLLDFSENNLCIDKPKMHDRSMIDFL